MVLKSKQIFFCFVTMHAFDRQTDRRTDRFSSLDRVCIPCSAVKPHDCIFVCLDKTPERDGQTEVQTDRQVLSQRSALLAM